jgi:hypothetical protein
VSRGVAILASLLVTIGRPTWWLLALCGFLVRGGFLVFFLPIVTLPSPLALSNIVAPLIVPVAFGQIGGDAVVAAAVTLVLLVSWLVVGGAVAGAMDLALIREARDAATDEGLEPAGQRSGASDRQRVGRILVARLIAAVPLALAIAIGLVRIVAIAYVELTNPIDVDTPLVARVAAGAAPQLAVVVLAWVFGEVVGGGASRWIALEEAPVARALARAVADTVRRPRSTLLPWLATSLVLLVVAGLDLAAARIAWERAEIVLSTSTSTSTTDTGAAAVALLAFVATWLAALVLTGVLVAIRSAMATFEHARWRLAAAESQTPGTSSTQDDPGTFGASTHHRPGDWSGHGEGGSL